MAVTYFDKENYQRKHEAIDSLIFAQKFSIDQKDTADKKRNDWIAHALIQILKRQK